MQFGVHLVRSGVLSSGDFVAVIERQLSERALLGTLAMEERKLSIKQLFAILDAQAASPKPFGLLAVELGFLTPQEVLQLVGMQCDRCRPVAELVVEMGLIDAATVRDEMQRFHAASHSRQAGREQPGPVLELSH